MCVWICVVCLMCEFDRVLLVWDVCIGGVCGGGGMLCCFI